MRMHKWLELSHSEEWQGFLMNNQKLEPPTGQTVTPQEILAGVGLLEVRSEWEIKTNTRILVFARAIARILK